MSRSLPSAEDPVDALFRECANDVHAYAISLLGDRSSAEDVTALAFERLFRSRALLDGRRGTPRAWLFAIARNAALDELRRRRRRPHYELNEERSGQLAASPAASSNASHRRHPGHAGPAEEALEHVERRATVHAALQKLPLRERELVLLKFHGQLSNAELARALGISESNAGTRLHRALMRLRECCADLDTEVLA